MKKFGSVFVLAAVSCLCAAPHNAKISTDLTNDQSKAAVDVIIQWKVPIGTATEEAVSKAGGATISEFKALDSGEYSVPGSALAALKNDPSVKYISPEKRRVHRKSINYKADLTASAVNAPYVWQSGYTGKGIGVAVVDSGITPVPDLTSGWKSDIVYTQDFTPTAYL
ncbi:MAG: hypothetical protein ACRD4G_19255, partial [Bryobacteraceae bacterium]